MGVFTFLIFILFVKSLAMLFEDLSLDNFGSFNFKVKDLKLTISSKSQKVKKESNKITNLTGKPPFTI